jgi:Cu/Zn superoxide dismutase
MKLLSRFARPGAILAIAVALGDAARAATPSPQATPPTGLIKLPNGDYTVPMRELAGSGTSGTVTLHPSGEKTIVTVYVFGSSKHRHTFRLHTGRDCNATNAGTVVAMQPAFGGQRTQTLVSLPISNLTSKGYVVDANDATGQRQFAEACAQLK